MKAIMVSLALLLVTAWTMNDSASLPWPPGTGPGAQIPKSKFQSPKGQELQASLGAALAKTATGALGTARPTPLLTKAPPAGFAITNVYCANGMLNLAWQAATTAPPYQVQCYAPGGWRNIGLPTSYCVAQVNISGNAAFGGNTALMFRVAGPPTGYAEYALPNLFLYAGALRGGIKNSGGIYCWLYQEIPGQENVLLWDVNGDFEIVPIFGYPNTGVSSSSCELVGNTLFVAAAAANVNGHNQILQYALSSPDAFGVPTVATLVTNMNWGVPADTGTISGLTTHKGSVVFMSYQATLPFNNSVAYRGVNGAWTFYQTNYTTPQGSFGAYSSLIAVDWQDVIYSFFARDSFGTMGMGRWQDTGSGLNYLDFRQDFFASDNNGGLNNDVRDSYMAPENEFPIFFNIAYDQANQQFIMSCNSSHLRITCYGGDCNFNASRPGIMSIQSSIGVPASSVILTAPDSQGQRVTFTSVAGAAYVVQTYDGTNWNNAPAVLTWPGGFTYLNLDILATNTTTQAVIYNPNNNPVRTLARPYVRTPLIQLPDYQERVYGEAPLLDPVNGTLEYYREPIDTNNPPGAFFLSKWDGTNITNLSDTRQPLAWGNGYATQWRVVKDGTGTNYTLIRGLSQ